MSSIPSKEGRERTRPGRDPALGATRPLSAHMAGPGLRGVWVWLGLLPFFAFVLAFMLVPASSILVGSFQDSAGAFTFANFAHLFAPNILDSYSITIKVSATTALLGGILGFLIAYGITLGGLPKPIRSFMSTFSGVASNFAGVPLAFAFIATLGRMGLLTVLLRTVFGINLYDKGFNLYSFWGCPSPIPISRYRSWSS